MTLSHIAAPFRAKVPFTLVIWTRADREQQSCTSLIIYLTSNNMQAAGKKVLFDFFTDYFTFLLLVKWTSN